MCCSERKRRPLDHRFGRRPVLVGMAKVAERYEIVERVIRRVAVDVVNL
jgi:hypothetical protein